MPDHGPFEPLEDTGEFGLVVHRLAEAAEDGGDRPDGRQPVPPYIAYHHAYAVLGGDHLVQIAADGGAAVGGELGRRDVQPADPRRQRPQQHALGGARDLAGLSQLPQQCVSDLKDQPGADGEEHGAGDDPRAEPVLLRERAGQFVGDRRRAPDGGQRYRQRPPETPGLPARAAPEHAVTRDPAGDDRPESFAGTSAGPWSAGNPSLDTDHADGPPSGPELRRSGPRSSTSSPGAGPILSTACPDRARSPGIVTRMSEVAEGPVGGRGATEPLSH
ncbi:hypothetical protein SAVCW2_10550 [Streptomyces avermitilis]|uniref:Uncharacterized protein n=1 Tax=Streptomyces avermitilis TaxID=33903 RepID=A0A4D4ML38_STRAX|nr:hypothetical protein SAVMC3_76530 [Streptomyces avermitilis]GDY72730.1 hypothetical protein SAV31267_022150 [Streptomyces avermitilis]GDY81856.1 hypothetical protein SAVCW2_10550 [Streptomyces avermitilis]